MCVSNKKIATAIKPAGGYAKNTKSYCNYMETIKSKISGLYIGLVIFLHFIIFIPILVSATYLRDIFSFETKIIAGGTIIAMVIIYVLLWKEILNAKKIVVDSNGIKIYNARSVREVSFSDIDIIQKEKNQLMMMKGVPFSDGYTYSELFLKRGKSVIISPDKYGNYSEIMMFIDRELKKRYMS